MIKKEKARNVDEYISQFPKHVQKILEEVRFSIKKAAPDAEETISYGMPAYKYNSKILVYFACYDKHVGLYATPSGHAAFEKELLKYKQGKGSVQFPLGEPMPLQLIRRIVQYRMEMCREQKENFLPGLSAPARRALQNNGIKNFSQLAKYSEDEILKLHGIGKTSIPRLNKALQEKGLGFAKK